METGLGSWLAVLVSGSSLATWFDTSTSSGSGGWAFLWPWFAQGSWWEERGEPAAQAGPPGPQSTPTLQDQPQLE